MSEDVIVKTAKSPSATIIYTVIVAAIVFGTLGYWLGSNKDKEEADESATAVVLESATVVSSSVVSATDETASWKTYTNEEYGFSFKYPSDWIVQITQNSQKSQILGLSLVSPEMQKTIKEERPDARADIFLDEFSKPKDFNLITNITSDELYIKDSINEKLIAGQKGYKAVFGGLVDETYYFWEKDNNYFRASTFGSITDFDLILSTFQFTSVK